LDIKDLSLAGCEKLNMDSTLEMIALNFKNIERLSIEGTNVTVLTEGIGGCTVLETLYLQKCHRLASLGDGIGSCTALQILHCYDCQSLQSLPPSIGGCTALQKLILAQCHSLTSLGDGIGGCTALQTLTLQGCYRYSLTSLGDDLRQQLARQGCEIYK